MSATRRLIAENARSLVRGKHGLSNVALADLLRLERRTVATRMDGDTPFFAHEIVVLARATGESIDAFYAGTLAADLEPAGASR